MNLLIPLIIFAIIISPIIKFNKKLVVRAFLYLLIAIIFQISIAAVLGILIQKGLIHNAVFVTGGAFLAMSVSEEVYKYALLKKYLTKFQEKQIVFQVSWMIFCFELALYHSLLFVGTVPEFVVTSDNWVVLNLYILRLPSLALHVFTTYVLGRCILKNIDSRVSLISMIIVHTIFNILAAQILNNYIYG